MKRILTITAGLLIAFAPAVLRAQTAAPTYQGQDGQTREATGIFAMPVAGAAGGAASSASPAAEGARIAKAGAGNVFGINATSGATAGFVLVINSATIPADGAVTPVKCYALAPNTSLDVNLRAMPLYLSAGIVVAFSSGANCWTKATSATAFLSIDAR